MRRQAVCVLAFWLVVSGPERWSAAANAPHGLPKFVPVDTSHLMGLPDPPPMVIEKALPALQFEEPVQVTHAGDGSDRLFVVCRRGLLYVIPNRANATPEHRKVFLDLRKVVHIDDIEEGLLDITFHPRYRQNGTFFLFYADRRGSNVVVQMQVSRDDRDRGDPASAVEILRIDRPYVNHHGGNMVFGRDGFLYVSVGDGGGAGDPHNHAQNLHLLMGKILRIDVDRREADRKYAIPRDNPLADRHDGVRRKIWAWGLRNVWRLSFDRATAALWAPDVGQDTWEEIDIIVRGGNYGWRIREGRHPFSGEATPPGTTLIDPVWEYHHSQGRSIIGGVVYRGRRFPELEGMYLYGDHVSHRLWALHYDGHRVVANIDLAEPRPIQVTSFGEDEAGEVYLTGFDGSIYTLRRAERKPKPIRTPVPRRLSETGLFSSTAALRPGPGLIPYGVNVPLWSDHGSKSRFLALPAAGQVRFSATGHWEFPVGTVLVKTFSLDLAHGDATTRRRLETRLLLRNPRGWAGYTYLWNDQQTDADLLDRAVIRSYQISDKRGRRRQEWYFPGRDDCLACHTPTAGFVLGLNTRQMNREFVYPGATDNQLRALEHIGVFSSPLPEPAARLDAFPDWDAPHAPRAVLARAYLDVNCSICHAPGGSAGVKMDLRFHTSPAKMGTVGTKPTTARIGPDDSQIIAPGRPDRSELYLRMKARGRLQMPNLATSLADEVALEQIAAWITSLRQ